MSGWRTALTPSVRETKGCHPRAMPHRSLSTIARNIEHPDSLEFAGPDLSLSSAGVPYLIYLSALRSLGLLPRGHDPQFPTSFPLRNHMHGKTFIRHHPPVMLPSCDSRFGSLYPTPEAPLSDFSHPRASYTSYWVIHGSLEGSGRSGIFRAREKGSELVRTIQRLNWWIRVHLDCSSIFNARRRTVSVTE